eukprot:2653836-Alexandrium_andersonii.AAC.1
MKRHFLQAHPGNPHTLQHRCAARPSSDGRTCCTNLEVMPAASPCKGPGSRIVSGELQACILILLALALPVCAFAFPRTPCTALRTSSPVPFLTDLL